ncbi:spore coat associated protein CotJA [Bacillus sp. 7884-1]|uniref:spore coat associated protein CotJA n=1 Tax=Bacillus sp. 7884-1 TaxID=2021693 RepID=UPI000BA78495|nr:spore coat associated protein CotJA [Bacillus sp. 7884-1]PAE43822.1 spore coat protein CotJA [Bacillus sp. 7884-1]TDL77018.1 spore coat associated protein CotJA [Rhodococcus qingshengii]
MFTLYKTYCPIAGPFDPCKPILEKTYSTPPNLYIGFQPPNLPQFSPQEALRAGTLWKPFYDPYFNPFEKAKGGVPR